jgi:hypothetical protein
MTPKSCYRRWKIYICISNFEKFCNKCISRSTKWANFTERMCKVCLGLLKFISILIVTGVAQYSAGLWAGWSGIRIPVGLGIFLFTTASRPALGTTQSSNQWVPGALFLGVKRPGCETDHPPPPCAIPPLPNTPHCCGAQLKHRDNFTITIHQRTITGGFIQKFPDWPPGTRTANVTDLCHQVQLYRYFVSQYSEFCRHNTLCCFSTSVYCCCYLFRYRLSPETFEYTLIFSLHFVKQLSH